MLTYLQLEFLVLERWIKRLDANQLLIMSLIAKMNPHNPRVKKMMLKGGYFRVTTRYIREGLAIKGISEATIYRALKHLATLGLLKVLVVWDKRTGKRLRYARPTARYWQAYNRVQGDEDRPRTRARIINQNDGTQASKRRNIILDNERGVDARAPSGAASPCEEELPSFEERLNLLAGLRSTLKTLDVKSKKW